MTTTHDPMTFAHGDTMQILGTLHYADGRPFNLNAGATVIWRLVDDEGNTMIDCDLDSGIVVTSITNGEVLIEVEATKSWTFAPGYYQDQCRATDPSGYVATQWQGRVDIVPSLWTPEVQPIG